MVGNLHKLSRVTSTVNSYNVRVANGSVIAATHVGEMDVEVMAEYIRKGKKIEMRPTVMHLTDVLVVPGLNADLFSCNAGIRSYFSDERSLELEDGGRVHFADGGDVRKNIVHYHRACAATTIPRREALVHPLLAHFSPDRLELARARMQPGIATLPSHAELPSPT